MTENEKVLQAMDEAAAKAFEDLKTISDTHITPIANWIVDHYPKAGYKRLAKILMKYATKKEEK